MIRDICLGAPRQALHKRASWSGSVGVERTRPRCAQETCTTRHADMKTPSAHLTSEAYFTPFPTAARLFHCPNTFDPSLRSIAGQMNYRASTAGSCGSCVTRRKTHEIGTCVNQWSCSMENYVPCSVVGGDGHGDNVCQSMILLDGELCTLFCRWRLRSWGYRRRPPPRTSSTSRQKPRPSTRTAASDERKILTSLGTHVPQRKRRLATKREQAEKETEYSAGCGCD